MVSFFTVKYFTDGFTQNFQMDETTKISTFKFFLKCWVRKDPAKLVLLIGDKVLEDHCRLEEYGLTGTSSSQTHRTPLILMDTHDWEMRKLFLLYSAFITYNN